MSTLAGPQRDDDRPTLDDYLNALTTVQAREEFIVLVRDVHTLPLRSVAEQARIDALNRCVERQTGDEQCKTYGHV